LTVSTDICQVCVARRQPFDRAVAHRCHLGRLAREELEAADAAAVVDDHRRRDDELDPRAAALDLPVHRLRRAALAAGADQLARLAGVVDRDAVDRDDAVALSQPRSGAGAASLDLAEHRLAPCAAESDLLHRLRVDVGGGERGEREMDAPLAAAVARADEQIDVLAAQHRLRHLPAQVGERADVAPFRAFLRPCAHPVAGVHAGAIGDASCDRRPEHRLRLVDADPVRRRVEDDREHEVRCRTGGDDRGALPEGLLLNARSRSLGGTSPSRSSSMRT
jgi:hypothetical protein